MQVRLKLAALVGAALFSSSSAGLAQQLPTPAEAQQALQSPEMAQRVRARLQSSGLSNEQIRARLRAAGYPENFLDAYLPGADSAKAGNGTDAAAALRAVEVADSLAQARAVAEARPTLQGNAVESAPGVFGLDIFRRTTTQFDPATAGPVDASYRVGPRDVLALILTGGVEAAYTLEVAPEGFVVIPQVGQVFVANLTLDQINDVLYAKLGRVYSGIRRGADASTRFTVTVARVRTNQIFVLGDVATPGSYQVSSAGTILSALYAAGGPTANGSLRDIAVRRAGHVVGSLDLYDYLMSGDASKDGRLQSGDVVFVPFKGRHVRVSGEVGRPATYELKAGETLRDLIRFAGGFTPTAARQRVQIRRILAVADHSAPGMERVVMDVAADGRSGEMPPFPLQAGDQVEVFPIADVERNRVSVEGNVWRPGQLGLRPGMRVSDALREAGGVRPDAYLDQVLVTRVLPDSSRVQLRAALRDTTGAVVSDFALQENDVIEVFSRAQFRPDRYITVAGAVRQGGRIPYREGMTLRDAVLLSGGLVEGAYLGNAEIARLAQDRGTGTLADTLRVPLDSTYLFERGPDGKYHGPPGMPALVANAPDVELRPYDAVLVLKQPDWQVGRRVRIGGEVRFPGTYTLTRRDERLADLIERAGGLTRRANPDGLRFYRLDGEVGRIDVDFRRALQDKGSRDNFVLMAGDSVEVPELIPVVKVSGAVSAPASVAYVPGRDASYYIAQAGGTAYNGDESRVYVVQPNGSRELKRSRRLMPDAVPEPLPGAEVIVPVKPEGKTDRAAVVGSIAQIMAGLVTVLVVALRR